MKHNHITHDSSGNKNVSFQDLQNQECVLTITTIGDIYIGRNSEKKMNLTIEKLQEILDFCKENERN